MAHRNIQKCFLWWLTSSLIVSPAVAFSTTRSRTMSLKTSSLFLNLDNFLSNFNVNKASKTAVIAGATGYIGKTTVRESVRQGYNTIALVRDLKKVQSEEGKLLYGRFLEGAKLVEADVCDLEALKTVSEQQSFFPSFGILAINTLNSLGYESNFKGKQRY